MAGSLTELFRLIPKLEKTPPSAMRQTALLNTPGKYYDKAITTLDTQCVTEVLSSKLASSALPRTHEETQPY
jgi:hypothetical protein